MQKMIIAQEQLKASGSCWGLDDSFDDACSVPFAIGEALADQPQLHAICLREVFEHAAPHMIGQKQPIVFLDIVWAGHWIMLMALVVLYTTGTPLEHPLVSGFVCDFSQATSNNPSQSCTHARLQMTELICVSLKHTRLLHHCLVADVSVPITLQQNLACRDELQSLHTLLRQAQG